MADKIEYFYRKNTASHGFIFIAEEELKISIRNLSITGLFAEFVECSSPKHLNQVAESLKQLPIIDFYLPEIYLAGEAKVVRTDCYVNGHIFFALQFNNIIHEVDENLYHRRVYRKNITDPGTIVFNGKKYSFITKNVSVDGLLIKLEERINVEEGIVTIFEFKKLELQGEIQVVWVEHCEGGATLMGLSYVHMEHEKISGIPRFLNS